MFNLIVSYNDPWPGDVLTMETGRIFEHTSDKLKRKYRDDDGVIDFDKLLKLPTLIMVEGTGEQIAYVCSITRVRQRGKHYSIEFVLDRRVPPLRNRALYEIRAVLDIEQWEFSRNHWAVKDVDLVSTLLPILAPARRLPTVFDVDVPEAIDQTLAAVMMPFGANFAPVYAAIKAAAEGAGLRPQRADDMWDADQLIQDIITLIDRAKVVVCDCTGRNPNVFYEAGIAHAFGRDVVLIAQSADDIPFDLRHYRYLTYLNNGEGLATLTKALQDRLTTIAAR
ncbi:MAG: hypothetical protein M3Q08_00655 [Pseudomonadota bacterium]|nr:hypothetical protein [Pseudomonadota bacterium]